MGSVADHVGGSTLALCEEETSLGEDPLVWPHPLNPHEALFEVHDAVEQATWGGASQSCEGVLATLSKLVDAATTVTGLSVEAQWLLTKEVTPRE